MNSDDALMQEAHWAARSIRANKPDDEKLAADVRVRLTTYRPRMGNEQFCPRCWMKDGIRSTLRCVSGTDDYDVLRCNSNTCGVDIIIPL